MPVSTRHSTLADLLKQPSPTASRAIPPNRWHIRPTQRGFDLLVDYDVLPDVMRSLIQRELHHLDYRIEVRPEGLKVRNSKEAYILTFTHHHGHQLHFYRLR